MTRLLIELKTRARLQLNADRHDRPDLRLRDCLHAAARDVGFAGWEHARRVLGGNAVAGDDMGTFWHAPACNAMLNAWFSTHAEARSARGAGPRSFLLPYRRHFVVADADFIVALGLDPAEAAWAALRHDLVTGYAGDAWATLAFQRIKAPRSTFASG
jgi:hypothetical protein